MHTIRNLLSKCVSVLTVKTFAMRWHVSISNGKHGIIFSALECCCVRIFSLRYRRLNHLLRVSLCFMTFIPWKRLQRLFVRIVPKHIQLANKRFHFIVYLSVCLCELNGSRMDFFSLNVLSPIATIQIEIFLRLPLFKRIIGMSRSGLNIIGAPSNRKRFF